MTEAIRNVFTGRVLTLNLERVRLPNGRVADPARLIGARSRRKRGA